MRRSESVALVLGDVRPSAADGVHLLVRRSKTDQDGQGQVKALPCGRQPATRALWR